MRMAVPPTAVHEDCIGCDLRPLADAMFRFFVWRRTIRTDIRPAANLTLTAGALRPLRRPTATAPGGCGVRNPSNRTPATEFTPHSQHNAAADHRSEEHTSELQSLMRI